MASRPTETEQFSELVGDLYDAAVVPALWPDVLGKIAAFVEGQSAALLTKDLVGSAGNALYTFGCDPQYLQLFLDGYWKLDPTTPLLFFASQVVASIADLMPYDEYLETRFHKEWAQPQGWVDWISAVLEKSATSFAFLTVVRKEVSGRVDDELRRRMQLVVPHVRRAVIIGKVIDLKTAEATTFADTLDGLSTCMFLVDANGRIVHANEAARCMLAAGDALHSRQRQAGGRRCACRSTASRCVFGCRSRRRRSGHERNCDPVDGARWRSLCGPCASADVGGAAAHWKCVQGRRRRVHSQGDVRSSVHT